MSSPGLLIPHLPEEKRTLKRALTQPTTPNIPMLHRVPLRRTQSLSARPQDVPNFSSEPESTGQEIRFQRPPLQNRTDTEISGLSLLVSFPRPPAPEVPVFATFDESQRPAESSPQIALQPASSVSLNQTDEPSSAGAAEEDNILAPQSIEGASLSRSGAIHSRAPSPRLRHANDTAVRSDAECGPLSMDGEHSFSVVATEENCPEPYLTGLSEEGPLSHTFGRPSPDSNFQPDEWSLVDGLEGEELSGSDGSRASGSGPGMAGPAESEDQRETTDMIERDGWKDDCSFLWGTKFLLAVLLFLTYSGRSRIANYKTTTTYKGDLY
ncbi:hypothetical protein DL96DRAFT_1714184 [Flagelloscypha sp. PMI_526]|nr:hypothetical protein DL96DRAFT_1714184 [Flagelloscypha sp. PMI_526]